MNITDIAWAAGYLDGDGSISIMMRAKNSHRLQIGVSSRDIKPVLKLKSLFGGAICELSKQERPMYYWRLSTKQAANCLRSVHPFLISKTKAANIGIKFQQTIGKPYLKVTDSILEVRERLRNELMSVNKED